MKWTPPGFGFQFVDKIPIVKWPHNKQKKLCVNSTPYSMK